MDKELIAEIKKLLNTNSINATANRRGITKKITYNPITGDGGRA